MARPVQMLEILVVSDHVIGTQGGRGEWGGKEARSTAVIIAVEARPLEKRDVLMHVGTT